MTSTGASWTDVPRSVGAIAEAVREAGGDDRKLTRIFERSPVPMVMVDAQRRHVEANRPARLWFRLSLEEMRRYVMEDFTPPDQVEAMGRMWTRLLETGRMAAQDPGVQPDRVTVVYCALADVLPGRHLIVCAPDWPEEESGTVEDDGPDPSASLTPREIEVLELAAAGTGIRQLSEELGLSPSTTRTHLKHIYAKLRVHNRTAAVTTAMRLGLIDG